MAAWLKSCGVDIVAMEATGAYWIALFDVLDKAGFDAHLVNAREVEHFEAERCDRQITHLGRQARRFNLTLWFAAA